MEWAFTGVTLFLGLLGLVLTVLWIFVPFAIFGIKSLLQEILVELRRANVIADACTPRAGRPAQPTDHDEPQGTLATIRAAVRQADKS